jgi:hypothetical protein
MFEWLQQEIGKIKTRRFHVVEGPADAALRAAIEGFEVPLPRSYKEFVLRFGHAKLFRSRAGEGYNLIVYRPPPDKEQSWKGEDLYVIGHYADEDAYFKGPHLHGEDETPVFEGDPSRHVKVSDGFVEWLLKRYKGVRRTYGKQKWAEIVAGPAPFTLQEQRIIEARKKFPWRVVGITPNQEFVIEVHNGSEMVLPYLSIGVRRKDGSPFGGIFLPVAHIHPGQTAIVAHDAYANVLPPSEVKLVPAPDPEPEDRDRYWEFKALSP